jgi:predicted PurR-regulated permease PerM
MSLTHIFKGTLAFLVALAVAYLLVLTINVWVSLLIAILVASAVRPAILRLMHWRIPQAIAVLIIYVGLAAVTIALLVIILPPVVNQFVGYIQNDNRLANRIIDAQSWVQQTVTQITGSEFELGITPEEIRASISDIVETVRVTAPSLVGNATGFLGEFLLIIVMGLYWVTSRERAVNFLIELVPMNRRGQVRLIFDEIEVGLGGYVRGIVSVSIIIGILSFIILAILRVPGAATISFFYAVATAIPIIGGLIGVVLATFLALLTSPINAVIVLVVTFLLQQVENYYLTPRVMAKGTDFDPLLVIVFVALGFSLGGIMGSLIAIPVAGTASILIKHLILEPRKATVAPSTSRIEGGILLHNADHPEV